MNRKVVSWLAIAAIAVVAAAFWMDRQASTGRGSQQTRKLWPAEATGINQIDRIRIARGDGSLVTLLRTAGGWQVAERSYAADAGKIRKLLLDLTALEIVEEKTSDPQRYAVLGIDPPTTPTAAGTLIELFAAGKTDKPAFALVAGKSAGAREMYARRPADKQGYLLRPSLTVDATPARWLDNSLLDIKAEAIRQLAARFPAGPGWTLGRDAATQTDLTLDSLAGKPGPAADRNVVTGLLGSFASLSFDDTRAAAPAPGAPGDQLVLTTFAGLEVEITGLRESDKRWIRLSARSSADASKEAAQRLQDLGAGREFEIPTWKYDAIFRKRDEIAPPTPRS